MLTTLIPVSIVFFLVCNAAIRTPNQTVHSVVTGSKVPIRPKGFAPGHDPKQLAIQRFKLLVSDFLTDAQLSKSIDVATVGMHKGKSLEDIMDGVNVRLRRMLSTNQLSELTNAQKGLVADLDENTARLVKSRIRRMIVYSFDPAAEQIHTFATKPSMAFALIAETLNERFVGSVKGLIRDVLTAQEYDAFRKNYHGIFKLDDAKTLKSSEKHGESGEEKPKEKKLG
ncbi:unnamed protein product [Caenorhabditis sp. 36 PRJEB53466]|nr:unnamed protein product [Caenorhabditis sp. 36 PRJEB53466]